MLSLHRVFERKGNVPFDRLCAILGDGVMLRAQFPWDPIALQTDYVDAFTYIRF
ncbi:MAG: hypothetical protein MUF51_08545 [Vicinamibacteria bacterium]|nr:hypothetical protein [Vicinamibacteria bacterium]